MSQLFSNLMMPEDSSSGSGELGKEEVIELLGEEKEETLEIEPKAKLDADAGLSEDVDDETEPEGEVDELKEIEEELEAPSEEDLELMTPVRRKEILAKYPKLFKDFPYLEKAYYREQQFTELLPTINDAKIAVNKAEVLDRFEREIMGGDITAVLRAAKEEDNDAFLKIADNYLPTLRKVDQQAYFHVLGNVIKDTIITMVRESRSLGEQGQPLQAAANILNQFVFGSNTFQVPTPLSKSSNPEQQSRENEIRNREQQLVISKFEDVKEDLQTRSDNVLKATIDSHIDPKGSMTDYVKKNATREAFDTLETLISKDPRFRGLLDKLWEKAFEKNFDKESTDRIKSAYLSKAKTLLPSVIKKARNEALKGLGKRRDDDEEDDSKKKSPASSTGRSTSHSGGKVRKAGDIPKGMSTLDVLMQD